MQELRFTNASVLAQHLAEDLAGRLRRCIEKNGRATLAVSGGKTPIAFFQALAQQILPWHQVLITLVDERWVDEEHEASNARLVREHLLQHQAKLAYFLPLKNSAETPIEGFMQCENALQEQIPQLDYAILGMGVDGHCASWFPGSSALSHAMSDESHARCCPVMDAPGEGINQRMTLTWHFLTQCRHVFLHIEGEQKLQVLKQAQQPDASLPISKWLTQSQVPLSLYCTEP